MSKPVRYQVYFHRGDELALMNNYRTDGGFRRKMREMARFTPHVPVYVWDCHYKQWARIVFGGGFIWSLEGVEEKDVPCLTQRQKEWLP